MHNKKEHDLLLYIRIKIHLTKAPCNLLFSDSGYINQSVRTNMVFPTPKTR
jgi:hypothetical protein